MAHCDIMNRVTILIKGTMLSRREIDNQFFSLDFYFSAVGFGSDSKPIGFSDTITTVKTDSLFSA